MQKQFELHNIIVTENTNITNSTAHQGVVNIHFNVDGFNNVIKVVAGYDYNGDEEDGRIFYANENEMLVKNNDKHYDSYGNYNLHCIIKDGEEIYYDNLFDYVVDAVIEYFQQGNSFINEIISHNVYQRLINN